MNTPNFDPSYFDLDYNFFTGSSDYYGEHSITNEDPLFIDPENGDFHLDPNSPAIDSGTSDKAPAFDYEGNSRPQGKGYDMGVYEYVPKN